MRDEWDGQLFRVAAGAVRSPADAVHDFLQTARAVVQRQAAVSDLTGQLDALRRDTRDIDRNLSFGLASGHSGAIEHRLAAKRLPQSQHALTRRATQLLHA